MRKGLAWALLLPPLLLLLWFHAGIISFPLAHSGIEACEATFAQALAQGHDPSSPAWVATQGSAYGFVHGSIVATLGGAQGADSLVLHRLVAGMALGLGLLLIVAWGRSVGAGRWETAAVALSLYAAWLFNSTPNGRPDALATALFVATYALALWPGQERAPAFFAGALGALAFFTKAYAVLGLPVAFLALAVDRRWPRAAALVAGAALSGALCTLWALHRFENYFILTLFLQAQHASFELHHLLDELQKLALEHGPLLLAVAVGAWARRRQAWSGHGAAMAALLPLLLVMCGHNGVYLSYLEQMGLPLLGMAALLWLPPSGTARAACLALLGLNLYAATAFLYRAQPPRPAQVRAQVEHLEQALTPLAPGKALLSGELQPLARRYGQAMPDNETLRHFVILKAPAWCQRCQAPARAIAEACQAHVRDEQAKLKAGAYDLVVLADFSPILQGADLHRYRFGGPVAAYAPGNPFQNHLSIYIK